jgi:hypothetical protein
MKEKLLALLVAKFIGVPEATLERIASKKAGSVTDESQLQSIVDGIDYGQIVQSDVDSKITEANKKAVQNYEATHKLKDGKPITDPTPGEDTDQGKDEAPAWAKALIEQNKMLTEDLALLKSEKTTQTRLQQLTSKFDGVPDSYKNQQLEYNKLLVGSMTDEQFATHISKVEADVLGFKQELADKGLSAQSKPLFGKADANGVSPAVSSYIASKADAGKQLTGKEV